MRRRGAITCVLGGVLAAVSIAGARAQRSFPVIDVHVPAPPVPLAAGGRTHLVYELHITNLSARQVILDAVEAVDGSARGAAPLLRLEGAALESALRRIGAPPDVADKHVLAGGESAVGFIWIALPPGSTPPASLAHRFTLKVDGERSTIDGVSVSVSRRATRVIAPPLRGDRWLAANGPDNASDHRRTVLALSGEGRIAQRFAIDWVRLYDEGRTYKGDALKNASYRAYQDDVLAVADGVVSQIHDGIPENIPDLAARAIPITPDTLSGNFIVLDIGGAYAVYAHLQPGSLMVRRGDKVRRGQRLARVGNNGNSTEPHLHFHLADRDSALDSEGLPYVFESFDLEAPPDQVTAAIVPAGSTLGIDPAALAKWTATPPQRRRREMPLNNAIVRF